MYSLSVGGAIQIYVSVGSNKRMVLFTTSKHPKRLLWSIFSVMHAYIITTDSKLSTSKLNVAAMYVCIALMLISDFLGGINENQITILSWDQNINIMPTGL